MLAALFRSQEKRGNRVVNTHCDRPSASKPERWSIQELLAGNGKPSRFGWNILFPGAVDDGEASGQALFKQVMDRP